MLFDYYIFMAVISELAMHELDHVIYNLCFSPDLP